MANKDEFLLRGIKTEPNNDNLEVEYNYNDDRDVKVDMESIEDCVKPEHESEHLPNIIQKEIHIKDEIPTMVSPLTVHAINDKVPHKIKHIRTDTLTKYTIIQNEKPFECNLCNFKTSHRKLLTVHMKIHIGKKPFIRYKCAQRNSLVRPMNIHTKQEEIHIKDEVPTMVRPLTVLKVQDNYNDDRNIKVDMESIEDCVKPEHLPNIKQKEIHIKDEIPTTVSPLTVYAINNKLPHKIMHIRTNTLTKYTIIQKEKPVECNLCMKIHTGDKPFLRYICNYKSAQKNSLVRHTSSHTREKPFACKLCEFKTAQKRYLKVHITRIHMREKS